MIPRLDEFTVEELETLLVAVMVGITYEGCEPEQYNNLCLWRTQIVQAISTVKMRNLLQQN